MIVLDYTSDNELRNGRYEFLFKKITIGFDTTHDLIVEKDESDLSYFQLETTAKGILIKPSKRGLFYLSNGKKIAGAMFHQVEDEITIEDVTFKIIDYRHIPISHHENDDLSVDRVALLDEIENEILHLEKELHV